MLIIIIIDVLKLLDFHNIYLFLNQSCESYNFGELDGKKIEGMAIKLKNFYF